jgi:rare lipoprotein A
VKGSVLPSHLRKGARPCVNETPCRRRNASDGLSRQLCARHCTIKPVGETVRVQAERSMRPALFIIGLALAWLVTSPEQAHSRGFGWFFAHSKPQGACSGQHVVATFYASGRRTASGETFNPSGHTAAHRTLPFGSRVTVTNPQNGNSVTVVINDRGPFTRGVTLDLSRGAARAIGMHGTQWLCML